MPTFTSDVRMSKVPELFHSSAGHAKSLDQTVGSGGGGPCEAVWWVKETQTQWRMRGQAYIVAPDIEEETEQSKVSSGVRTVKSELGSRMRVVKEDGKDEWSWNKELTAHFGNNSPGLRGKQDLCRIEVCKKQETDFISGTFAAPPPGQKVTEPYDDKNLKLGQKITELDHPVARKNFRVVVVKPDEMEQLDISNPEKARRQHYTFDKSTGEWQHEETWP